MPQELENLMNDRASFAMKVESNSTQSCSNHNSDIINFIKNQTIDYIFLSQTFSLLFTFFTYFLFFYIFLGFSVTKIIEQYLHQGGVMA